MAKQELEYGKCRIIANSVEALLVNVGSSYKNEACGVHDVAYDFLNFLIKKEGLNAYWRNSYEISPICTQEYDKMVGGVKFTFLRLVSPKNSDSISMGAGTQWVSDVITLMKDFLLSERETYDIPEEDEENDEGWWQKYHDAKLIFRVDGKQFDWK